LLFRTKNIIQRSRELVAAKKLDLKNRFSDLEALKTYFANIWVVVAALRILKWDALKLGTYAGES